MSYKIIIPRSDGLPQLSREVVDFQNPKCKRLRNRLVNFRYMYPPARDILVKVNLHALDQYFTVCIKAQRFRVKYPYTNERCRYRNRGLFDRNNDYVVVVVVVVVARFQQRKFYSLD